MMTPGALTEGSLGGLESGGIRAPHRPLVGPCSLLYFDSSDDRQPGGVVGCGLYDPFGPSRPSGKDPGSSAEERLSAREPSRRGTQNRAGLASARAAMGRAARSPLPGWPPPS